MNSLGYRVSQLHHKALNPTTIPIIIDNKLFLLTEQLSRHVVDTKLSFLIPHPQINFGIAMPENPSLQSQFNVQLQPDPLQNPMTGNLEQQIILERMRGQFFMDMMHANANYANQQIASQYPSGNIIIQQPPIVHDASTHTFDLLQSEDVEMKPTP